MASTTIDHSKHPDYHVWAEDEKRMRATYHGLRRLLVDYLVPHRFEADENTRGRDLRRSKYGFVPKLNASWVGELMGHVRSAVARYDWGDLEEADDEVRARRESAGETAITRRPAGGAAQYLWDDITLSGVTWRKFFGANVLEWMLTSPGGFVLCDAPDLGDMGTQLAARRAGKRPYAEWVPLSRVVDLGTGGHGLGFRWVEVLETPDLRQPVGRDQAEPKMVRLLYELDERGHTIATRRDEDGRAIEEPRDLGLFADTEGFPMLPLVPAFFGQHPEIPWAGQGLILGLDDVVIDIFNRYSEVVEGFRDGAFTVHTYKGSAYNTVMQTLQNGARLVDLGDDPDAALERLDGGLMEVQGGLELVALGLQAWSVGAKRKSAEAMERAEARSGVSLKAEFQLDSRPLLTEIAEALDEVESNTMWVLAQLAGLTPDQSRDIRVERNTAFQVEDEASRITRIVGEFATALPIPATLMESIIMRWAEASELVDMDAEVESATGEKTTARELLRAEAAEVARARQRMSTERGDLFAGVFGPAPATDTEEVDEAA